MYKQYTNVSIGKNVIIEDFVIIGKPPGGAQDGEFATVIGDNAIIRSHTVIYAGNTIGDDVQTGHHVTIREHNKIGHNVSIGTSSVVEHRTIIEDHVRIHSQAFICEFTHLKSHAWIGPNVVFTNAKYPQYDGVKQSLIGIVVSSHAKIGANATLLPGIHIGKNALIGSGAVVTKSVPPNEIWAGNPAKKIKNADEVGYLQL
jgi:acetyltransferase-like isoleucine patch superfamily enzyme